MLLTSSASINCGVVTRKSITFGVNFQNHQYFWVPVGTVYISFQNFRHDSIMVRNHGQQPVRGDNTCNGSYRVSHQRVLLP